MKNSLFAGQLPVDRARVGRIPATTDRRFSTGGSRQGMTATMANPEFVYVNGDMVPYEDVTIHVSRLRRNTGRTSSRGCALMQVTASNPSCFGSRNIWCGCVTPCR